jgi:hypothetical protein
MKFRDWIQSKIDIASSKNFDFLMKNEDAMSRAGFQVRAVPHGEYKPKNFDRYVFEVDEDGASKYSKKLQTAIRNDVQISIEALAGYYGNDAIVKALDDFLTELSRSNVVL